MSVDDRSSATETTTQGGASEDWGPPLPELAPQPRVRAMVRDPGTTYIYWEGPAEPLGWELRAEGAGAPAAVRVREQAAYVEAPVASLERVVVRPVGAAKEAPRSASLPRADEAPPDLRWRAVGEPRASQDAAAEPPADLASSTASAATQPAGPASAGPSPFSHLFPSARSPYRVPS